MQIQVGLKSIAITACVLLIALGVMLYSRSGKAPDVSQQQYAPAPEVKETVKIKRVEVPGPTKIVTIEKEVVAEKLKLPGEISSNPDKQIIATAVVAPYDGDTHAVAVMDTKTGQGSISVKQEPLPFFAFKNLKEMGGRGGIALSSEGVRYRVDVYAGGHFSA
jgi:glucose/arabinose dehydrogenase